MDSFFLFSKLQEIELWYSCSLVVTINRNWPTKITESASDNWLTWVKLPHPIFNVCQIAWEFIWKAPCSKLRSLPSGLNSCVFWKVLSETIIIQIMDGLNHRSVDRDCDCDWNWSWITITIQFTSSLTTWQTLLDMSNYEHWMFNTNIHNIQ